MQIGDQVRFANDPVVLTVFEVTTDSNGTYIRTQNLEKKMRSDGWITGPMARQYEIVGRAIPNRITAHGGSCCCPKCDPETYGHATRNREAE